MHLQEEENDTNMNFTNSQISKKVDNVLYKSAKESTKKKNTVSISEVTEHHSKDYNQMMNQLNDEELRRWKEVTESKDSKKLRKQFNWNGNMNEITQTEHSHRSITKKKFMQRWAY